MVEKALTNFLLPIGNALDTTVVKTSLIRLKCLVEVAVLSAVEEEST